MLKNILVTVIIFGHVILIISFALATIMLAINKRNECNNF